MKKILAIILLLLIFIPQTTAFAIDLDYKSMSSEDLASIIDQCRIELASRQTANGANLTIVNESGIEIYLTNHYTTYQSYDQKHYVDLSAAVVNNSGKPFQLYDNGCCINGWKVGTTFTYGEIPSGKMKNIEITFCLNDANISTFEEIKEIDFALKTYDPGNYLNVTEFTTYTFVK